MPIHKHKPHKGLLKRVKVTATGKVKFRAANNGHLRSKKTGRKISALRQKKVAKPGDVVRFEAMLHRSLA